MRSHLPPFGFRIGFRAAIVSRVCVLCDVNRLGNAGFGRLGPTPTSRSTRPGTTPPKLGTMPKFSARLLIGAAHAGWRFAPIEAVDRCLCRVQQALSMVQGYGFECLDDEVAAASGQLPPCPAVIFDVGAHKGEWSRGVLARRRGARDHFSYSSLRTLTSGSCASWRLALLQ